MHRRAFLDPRRLATTAGHVIAALGTIDHTPSTSPDAEITLVRYARPAMGTVFEIVLPFGHPVATETIHQALDIIDAQEDWLTVYRETSEVSDVNRRAGSEAVGISDELFCLIKYADILSRWTDGAFDVAAGALIDAWGFRRGPRRLPSEADRLHALSQSGYQHLDLGEAALSTVNKTLHFNVPGLSLNFGSIGKGYALDAVASFFEERIPKQPVLLHGGKSSVLALGKPPGHERGWSVGIEHPWNPDAMLATVYLTDQAMATSAATYKHLVHEGKKLGHILDPRTGWPAQGIASATAIASTAAMADALSTAFYIMGVDETTRFCKEHPYVGAILLAEGSREPVMFNVS